MDKRAVGRKVALVTGLGVVLVIALGVVYWRDFLVRYHLYRLEREEGCLAQLLGKQNGTTERKAIREFIKKRSGAQAVLRCYLSEFERVYTHKTYLLKDVEKGLVGLGTEGVPREAGRFWHDLRWLSGATAQGDELASAPCVIGMVEVMDDLLGRDLALTSYPALRFRVLRLDEAMKLYEQGLPPDNVYRLGDLHQVVCMIQRERTRTSVGTPRSP